MYIFIHLWLHWTYICISLIYTTILFKFLLILLCAILILDPSFKFFPFNISFHYFDPTKIFFLSFWFLSLFVFSHFSFLFLNFISFFFCWLISFSQNKRWIVFSWSQNCLKSVKRAGRGDWRKRRREIRTPQLHFL